MPEHVRDERLLVEAAQNDPGCFVELYELHFERVYAYIASRVRNRADAEDLTAHVFHQALEHLPRFEWRGVPFAVWLFRIASNAMSDRWRREALEKGQAASGDPTSVHPASGEPRVDPLLLEEVECRARLFRLVAELSQDQNRVVVMRFVEEKSIRQVAQAIQRSEGAVKQLQFRALKSLRAWMSESNG